MQLLSDRPLNPLTPANDHLGLLPIRDALCDLALRAQELPATVGVFGGSGCGKSTLLRAVEAKLQAGGTRTVWFNPWHFDRKQPLWSALIGCILRGMETTREKPRGRRWVQALAEASELLKAATGEPPVTESARTAAPDGFAAFADGFETIFQELVTEFCPGGTLVVFIDDLDRCLPQNAITVLEAIQQYLGRGNALFLVAADPAVLSTGLAAVFGDGAAPGHLAKLVPTPFHLPPSQQRDLAWLLDRNDPDSPAHSVAWALALAVLGNDIRQLKRFLNAWSVAASVAKATRGALDEDAMGMRSVMLLTAMQFPAQYAALASRPDGLAAFLAGAGRDALEFTEDDHFDAPAGTADLTRPAFREFLQTVAAIWPAVSAQAPDAHPPVAFTASASASQ